MSMNDKINALVSKVAASLDTGIRRIVDQEVKAAGRKAVMDQKSSKKVTASPKTAPKGAPKRGRKTGYASESDGSTDDE